ncbi:hypothetical protein FQR65_LT10863 [Abscondita terminalis]|nr:hypothetical protein FQR65_LT10863 [Abscondita terminalis]
MKWVISIVLIAIAIYFIKRGKNNVCKTFNDYYTDRDNNPNCYYNPDHELEAKILNYFGGGEIYPRPLMPRFLFKFLCFPLPFQIFACQILDMMLLGYNYEDNDPESLPVTLLYNIDATSIKTLTHYLQAAYSGNFQYYDYGEEQNKLIYSDNNPPHYNLSNIQFDNFIVYSENDKFLPEKSIHRLYKELPNKQYSKKLHKIKNSRFNHIDILFAKHSDQLVFTPILNELQRRNNKV